MELSEVYRAVQPSIIAFTPKYVSTSLPRDFPPIFGTGFVIGDNLIVTNDHVFQVFRQVLRPQGIPRDDWAVIAWIFCLMPEGMAQIPLEVIGGFRINLDVQGIYYGPERPDIALVHVKAMGLPALRAAEVSRLEPGIQIATAGFTMGTDALRAPGWIHQLTPTLQTGIISAVLPFPCETPHGVMINIMTQGGASGSPVFSFDKPEVLGVLYAGLFDHDTLPHTDLPYKIPTNFSYFVPAHYLRKALEGIEKDENLKTKPGTLSLEQMIATYERDVHSPENRTKKSSPDVTGIVSESKVDVVRTDIVRVDASKESKE